MASNVPTPAEIGNSAVYERAVGRPKLTKTDRAFWLALIRF